MEKYSALLEIDGEDQVPVNANHRDMCKFDSRDNETYKKLVKRLNRMLKAKENASNTTSGASSELPSLRRELPMLEYSAESYPIPSTT